MKKKRKSINKENDRKKKVSFSLLFLLMKQQKKETATNATNVTNANNTPMFLNAYIHMLLLLSWAQYFRNVLFFYFILSSRTFQIYQIKIAYLSCAQKC